MQVTGEISIFSSPEPNAHQVSLTFKTGSIVHQFTISKKNISEAGGSILIKFDVNQYWGWGIALLVLEPKALCLLCEVYPKETMPIISGVQIGYTLGYISSFTKSAQIYLVSIYRTIGSLVG